MFEKINISNIVRDHLATLKDYKTQKISLSDIILFLILPISVSVIIMYNYRLCKDIVSILITSFSIFAALLFNLLLIIYDIINKHYKKDDEKIKLKKPFLKEIYSNISFSILIAIVIIVLALSLFIINKFPYRYFIEFIIYYSIILFILTLFMILKRIHILLSKEIEIMK